MRFGPYPVSHMSCPSCPSCPKQAWNYGQEPLSGELEAESLHELNVLPSSPVRTKSFPAPVVPW